MSHWVTLEQNYIPVKEQSIVFSVAATFKSRTAHTSLCHDVTPRRVCYSPQITAIFQLLVLLYKISS